MVDSAPPTITSFEEIAESFRGAFGRHPEVLVRAPGRVNLLGAHIDYHEGWVLPGAVDRSIWLAAARTEAERNTWHALDLGESVTVDGGALPPPVGERQEPISTWQDYPAGVVWALRHEAGEPPALDAVFGGNLPRDAGVSSSAALEVAFLLAWNELGDLDLEPDAIAALGRSIENRYIGVGSGIMDQQASLWGRMGQLLLLDCRDLSKRWITLPPDCSVLVADSGVRRRLAGSSYNQRVLECAEALAELQRSGIGARTLRDVLPADLVRAKDLLPARLFRRVRHVVEECSRVQHGAQVLADGNLTELGDLMRASHESSRDLYEVSIPELDALASTAWSAEGCYGARLSGGGFGGCVTALVQHESASAVAETVRQAFSARFGRSPAVFECRIEAGAEAIRCG